MSFTIIDRRKNSKNESLSNRQRFLNRAQKAIRSSAKKALGNKSINDYGDTNVSIPTDGIDEPHFRHDSDFGEYDYVLPGNDEFIVGDRLKKPKKNSESGGSGSGNGDGDGGGDDEFEFALSYEEYLNIIFDDLELPDLIKKTEKNSTSWAIKRAGYTTTGMPTNINVPKTAIAGMARRIALRAPKLERIAELEKELIDLEEIAVVSVFDGEQLCWVNKRIAEIEEEITTLRTRAAAINYLDNVDMRFNNFVKQPRPITRAVMFCMMDVSFSMGEREKIIAKKFFVLLHLFLKRRYENIEVVFVRHHDSATECDEDTFFTSREGGGTVVSSGYVKIKEIIENRFNPEDWNIYIAQASDGDNYGTDNKLVEKYLTEDLLPITQHFTYLEIEDPHRSAFMADFGSAVSNLWQTIQPLTRLFDNVACASISDERQVVNVFRKLFKKEIA
jgi:uncharacterized sporulation protein YeaH/YhbH (DUF444 family)